MSTNKVYGDRPNTLALVETETRWDYADPEYRLGIPESFSINQSVHSLFGASKAASDVKMQEYGRYFGIYPGGGFTRSLKQTVAEITASWCARLEDPK